MRFSCRNGHTWKSAKFKPQPHERMCRECGLPAEASLKSNAGSGLQKATEPRILADAHTRFSQLVTEWPCFLEARRPGHKCYGPRDPHHLVPASWIKETYGDLSDPELADILYAPIVGCSLCRDGHEAVERRVSEFIFRRELDPELFAFCRKVDRRYPDRPSMVTRLELESPTSKAAAA